MKSGAVLITLCSLLLASPGAFAGCPTGQGLLANGTYSKLVNGIPSPCRCEDDRFNSAVGASAPASSKNLFDPALEAYKSKLETSGWCCALPSPTGLTCRGKMPKDGYPEDIVMMIPPFYLPEKEAPLSVFLHGHLIRRDKKGQLETFDSLLKELNLDAKHAKNRRNSILVVPASRGRSATHKEWFNDSDVAGKGQFPELLHFVVEQTRRAGLSKEAVAGKIYATVHSGGVYPLAGILAQSCKPYLPCPRQLVQELFLMDAGYDTPTEAPYIFDTLVQFKKARPEVSLYAVAHSSLEKSTALLQRISGQKWKDSFFDAGMLRTDVARKPQETDDAFRKRRLETEKAFNDQVGAALDKGLRNDRTFLAHWGTDNPDHWNLLGQFLPLFWAANP